MKERVLDRLDLVRIVNRGTTFIEYDTSDEYIILTTDSEFAMCDSEDDAEDVFKNWIEKYSIRA